MIHDPSHPALALSNAGIRFVESVNRDWPNHITSPAVLGDPLINRADNLVVFIEIKY